MQYAAALTPNPSPEGTAMMGLSTAAVDEKDGDPLLLTGLPLGSLICSMCTCVFGMCEYAGVSACWRQAACARPHCKGRTNCRGVQCKGPSRACACEHAHTFL